MLVLDELVVFIVVAGFEGTAAAVELEYDVDVELEVVAGSFLMMEMEDEFCCGFCC